LKENTVVHVEIRVGSEKEPRCSEPFAFSYVTRSTERCQNCKQIKSFLQKLCNGETTASSVDAANLNLNSVNIKSEKSSSVEKVTTHQHLSISKTNTPNNPNSILNMAPSLTNLLKPTCSLTVPAEVRKRSTAVFAPVSTVANASTPRLIPATVAKTIFNTPVPNLTSLLQTNSPTVVTVPIVNSIPVQQSLQSNSPLTVPVASTASRNILLANTSIEPTQPQLGGVQIVVNNKTPTLSQQNMPNAGILNSIGQSFAVSMPVTTLIAEKIKQEQTMSFSALAQEHQVSPVQGVFNSSTVTTPLLAIASSLAPPNAPAVSCPQVATTPSIETMIANQQQQIPPPLNQSNNSVPNSPIIHKVSTPLSSSLAPATATAIQNYATHNTQNLATQSYLQNQLVTLTNIMQSLKKQIEMTTTSQMTGSPHQTPPQMPLLNQMPLQNQLLGVKPTCAIQLPFSNATPQAQPQTPSTIVAVSPVATLNIQQQPKILSANSNLTFFNNNKLNQTHKSIWL